MEMGPVSIKWVAVAVAAIELALATAAAVALATAVTVARTDAWVASILGVADGVNVDVGVGSGVGVSVGVDVAVAVGAGNAVKVCATDALMIALSVIVEALEAPATGAEGVAVDVADARLSAGAVEVSVGDPVVSSKGQKIRLAA